MSSFRIGGGAGRTLSRLLDLEGAANGRCLGYIVTGISTEASARRGLATVVLWAAEQDGTGMCKESLLARSSLGVRKGGSRRCVAGSGT